MDNVQNGYTHFYSLLYKERCIKLQKLENSIFICNFTCKNCKFS